MEFNPPPPSKTKQPRSRVHFPGRGIFHSHIFPFKLFFFPFCCSDSYDAIVSCFLQINKVRMGFNYCLGGNRVDENNMAKFQKVIRDTLKE